MLDGRMMDFPLTATHFLDRARTLFPKTEVVWRRGDGEVARSNYGAVMSRAAKLANALTKLGVKTGDRVATLAWNNARHLEAYSAIPAMGAVLHTLNLRLAPPDIGYIAAHAGDSIILVDDSLVPLLKQFLPVVKTVTKVIVMRDGAPKPSEEALEGVETLDYETLIAAEKDDFAWPELDERSAAILCYTSGTTGRPKGVAFTHRSCALHTLAACMPDTIGVKHDDVVLPVVPMFHANAWGLPYAVLATGAKLVMPGPKLDAKSVLELIKSEKVTVAAGVPTVWIAILDELDRNAKDWDVSTVRNMLIGGSAVPAAMIDGFKKRHGLDILHAWGMTEMNPLGSVARVKTHLQKGTPEEVLALKATQGHAAIFVEMRHTDDEGKVLPRDAKSMGELEVRGPWVASSYINDEDAHRWTKDGWFKTGDVVTLCPEGYVRICDRSKDVIKSGGEWISSVDLENALMGHPAVLEAAVFAGKHKKWDERPIAAVVLKKDAKATEEELAAYMATKVAKWMLPDAYVFVEQVPRTSTGKFLKIRLREQFGDMLLSR